MDVQHRIKGLLERGLHEEAYLAITKTLDSESLSELERFHVLVQKAQLHVKRGNCQTSLAILDTISKDANTAKSLEGSGDEGWNVLLLHMAMTKAEALSDLSLFDESVDALDQASALLEPLRDGEFLEETKDLWINIQLLKGTVSFRSGKHEDALNILAPLEEIVKGQESPFLEAKVLNILGSLRGMQGEHEEGLDYFLRSLALKEQIGNKQEIAISLNNIGYVHANLGRLDVALVYLEGSLVLKEQFGNKQQIARTLNCLGIVHQDKGELDVAMDNFTRSLELMKEIGNKQEIARSYVLIGNVHRNKGKPALAMDLFNQALGMQEEIGSLLLGADILFELVGVALDMRQTNKAAEYVDLLKNRHIDAEHNKQITLYYRLAKALRFKNLNRRKYHVESQSILEDIVHDEEKAVDHRLRSIAIVHLCDLLLQELYKYGEKNIVAEIQILADDLLQTARAQSSHSLIGEAYLLLSRLALLELDPKRSQRLLAQSQIVCAEKGLQHLAIRISKEHDKLLDNLENWDLLAKNQAPYADRIDLANIGGLVKSMTQQQYMGTDKERAQEMDEDTDQEDPYLLLIMDAKSGVSHYHKVFHEIPMDVDEQLISGFISAIMGYAGLVFEENLNRIKLKEYTVLVEPQEQDMLLCYAFRGQSYFANQKLQEFAENIRADPTLWQSLRHSIRSGAVLKKDQNNTLNEYVSRTFVTS